MLDLILSEHTGTATQLPNLNNSNHVAVFLSLATSYHSAAMPPNYRVFHWSHAPWRKLSQHFHSVKWNFHRSVNDISTRFANIIVPSCILKGSRPTPWWNRFCEAAWQHKITCWQRNGTTGFT